MCALIAPTACSCCNFAVFGYLFCVILILFSALGPFAAYFNVLTTALWYYQAFWLSLVLFVHPLQIRQAEKRALMSVKGWFDNQKQGMWKMEYYQERRLKRLGLVDERGRSTFDTLGKPEVDGYGPKRSNLWAQRILGCEDSIWANCRCLCSLLYKPKLPLPSVPMPRLYCLLRFQCIWLLFSQKHFQFRLMGCQVEVLAVNFSIQPAQVVGSAQSCVGGVWEAKIQNWKLL